MRTLEVSFATMLFQTQAVAQTLVAAREIRSLNQGYRLGGACSTQLETHEFGTRISGPIAVAWL